jgi:ribose transport system substrate-binding protein
MRAARLCVAVGTLAILALYGLPGAIAADSTNASQAEALRNVPPAAVKYYAGYQFSTTLVDNPLKGWTPHRTPWQVCHNDSYLGNQWRANVVGELKSLVKQLADRGLAKKNLIITNSNGDVNLELTQLKAEVAQGCDLITVYPGSATGLCSGIKDAFAKGILIVTIDAPVNCPGALNVARNPYFYAKYNADWAMKQIGAKGHIVLTNGHTGTSDTVAERSAFLAAVKAHPDVKVVGDLYGMWTGSVAKVQMLKFLATHPQPIDAVLSTGNMAVGVGQAFEQLGRKLPVIAAMTNNCGLLAYWKRHNLDSLTLVQDGGPTLYEAFVVAMHAMVGQKPKVNTIFLGPIYLTSHPAPRRYTMARIASANLV